MFKAKKLAASAALAAAMFVPSAAFAANLLVNGSFESPGWSGDFDTLAAGSTFIDGWIVGGGGVDYIGSYWTASDGNQSVDLNALSAGSISQTLHGLTVGATYDVSFDLAGNPAGGPNLKSLLVDGAGNQLDTETFDITGHSFGAMGWTTHSFSFTATGVDEVLSFVSTTDGFSDNRDYPNAFGPVLDNVVVTAAAVPEPAQWALMLAGFGAMGFAMRRRRQSAISAAIAI